MTTATGEAVIDSSVVVSVVTPEVQSKWSLQKITEYQPLHTLDLCHYEVANALRYKTTDSLTKSIQAAWLTAKDLMSLFIHHTYCDTVDEAISEAKNLNIAIYDASYVMLADKLRLPLLTVDMKLVKRLEGTKYYELLEFPDR